MSETVTKDGEILSPGAGFSGAFFMPGPQQDMVPATQAARPVGQSESYAQVDSALGRIVLAQRVALPRVDAVIFQRIREAAHAAGDAFYWGWEVKNRDGTKKWIEGPSIDAAMAVASAYQNCSVRSPVEDLPEAWIFHAEFVDYERGYVLQRSFYSAKPKAGVGGVDPTRWRDMQFGAAQSKAQRNVINAALGRYCDYAVQQAKEALVERVKGDPEKALNYALTTLDVLGVDVSNAAAAVGYKIERGMPFAALARLIATLQSVTQGQLEAEDVFPDPKAARERDRQAGASAAAGWARPVDQPAADASGEKKPEDAKPTEEKTASQRRKGSGGRTATGQAAAAAPAEKAAPDDGGRQNDGGDAGTEPSSEPAAEQDAGAQAEDEQHEVATGAADDGLGDVGAEDTAAPKEGQNGEYDAMGGFKFD